MQVSLPGPRVILHTYHHLTTYSTLMSVYIISKRFQLPSIITTTPLNYYYSVPAAESPIQKGCLRFFTSGAENEKGLLLPAFLCPKKKSTKGSRSPISDITSSAPLPSLRSGDTEIKNLKHNKHCNHCKYTNTGVIYSVE